VVKPSRRALVVAASFALGLSAVGPAAHAGLLGGGSSDTAVEGVPLPVGGELLGGDGLLGSVLGGDGLLGGVLGGEGVLGGVLGDDGLLGGGLPVGGDLVDGVLGGDSEGLLAGEGVAELLPALDVVPGLGSVSEILEAFSDSGSIVPGLQVLDELGVLGILGSL